MPTEAETAERPRKKKKQHVDPETARALRRVTDLVALAHENENVEEARNAALAAVNLMHEHRLCVIPESEVERLRRIIGGMQERAKSASEERMKHLGLGFVAGMVLGKGKMF